MILCAEAAAPGMGPAEVMARALFPASGDARSMHGAHLLERGLAMSSDVVQLDEQR